MSKNKGYYFGKYDILTKPYSGSDFSRRCFIFPGQGAAFPGMAKKEYENSEIIQKKFALADALVQKFDSQRISDYIISPENLKKETLPAITNLALFTLESALFDIFISSDVIPEIVTGHSFGEYGALVASGIISFEDMVSIVYHRDIFCPPANSLGFMVAINADVKKIKSILKNKDYYISNINSPRQTVLSVSKNALDEITTLLKKEELRHKILYNVPQPYHSPYLKSVEKKVDNFLKDKNLSFKKPSIPLFSSVLGKLINKKNFRKRDIRTILIHQITTQVDFINQIEKIYDARCFTFLELGPKKLFSIFVEDILTGTGKEAKTEYALDLLTSTKKETIETVNSGDEKLFSSIQKTIGAITGYEAEKISPENRFQEDLGIDSIKKAEILLTVLNEANIYPGEEFNTSDFTRIKDVLSYLEKTKKANRITPVEQSRQEKKTDFKRYVFVPTEKPFGNHYWTSQYKEKILSLKIGIILKNESDCLKKISLFLIEKSLSDERKTIILSTDGAILDLEKILVLFKFFRAFSSTIKDDRFNLVLFSSESSLDKQQIPLLRCLVSFLKSLKKELPGMFFKHVRFEKSINKKSAMTTVMNEVHETSTTDVFYKNGKRFILEPRLANKEKNLSIGEKSVIVAIGGAKGITFSLIKNLSQKYKPIVYLVGKSLESDALVRKNITQLKQENPKIYYESLDARNIDSIEELFSRLKKQHKKIDLVINGAGAVKIGFLKEKTGEEIDYEFNNKVLPAENILKLALKYKPKRIINFSSVISHYGSAGQSIYTSANELVSELTKEYNSILKKTGSSAVTIHWPPWDGVGMTSNKGVFQKLNEYGVSLLKPERADELFLSDLSPSNNEPVYYLDNSDDLLCSFPLNDLRRYEPLIGEISDPFNISASILTLKKRFDLSKDIYLKDHTIKKSSYVPAATGIGMFLCLGNMYFKRFPTLNNIVISNPIIVKNNPVSCTFEAENRNDKSLFSIRSNALFFSCEAEAGKKEKAPRYNLKKPEKEVLIRSIYSDYYSKDSLYLGPTFQSINKALIDKDENPFFIIDNSKLPPVLGLGFYDKLIQWIDVLFQATSAVGLMKNFRTIPVSVSRLSIFSQTEISNRVYAIPIVTKYTGDEIEGNVALVNEKGDAIIELAGVLLKKIGEYEENKLEIKKYRNG